MTNTKKMRVGLRALPYAATLIDRTASPTDREAALTEVNRIRAEYKLVPLALRHFPVL